MPATLSMEPDVRERVDAHYGGPGWASRLPQYMAHVAAVDTNRQWHTDASHMADPYGAVWRTDCRPWHLETVPLSEPTLEGYHFPVIDDFVVPGARESSLQVCQHNPDLFVVGNLGWGLFERAWTMRGFENLLMDFVAEEAFVEGVLDRLMELYLSFVDATAALPIDGILFGDDWGDQRGVIVGPERWRRLLKPRWARIYERVHSYGKVVMAHSCGSVADIIPDLIGIGLDVLESVQPEARGMNPYELKRNFGADISFWGALGSQSTIPFGTPEAVRAEVFHLCDEMGKGGGYIFAPAKDLQPETPTENAVAIIEALAELACQ